MNLFNVFIPSPLQEHVQEQTADDTDKDTGTERKIKREIVTFNKDITGQSPQPSQWTSFARPFPDQRNEDPYGHNSQAHEDHHFAKAAEVGHGSP